jgi:hypothetical protein
MYGTVLRPECKVSSVGALKLYGFEVGNQGRWVGIVFSIIVTMMVANTSYIVASFTIKLDTQLHKA